MLSFINGGVIMLFEMFVTFLKIGAFTFGGGYGMIPIVQKEIVTKRKWINEDDFLDAMAVAQGSPGPMAVNVSIYVGYKVKGIVGAIVAALGSILPSFTIILIIAKYLYQYRNNPILDKVFMGIRPAIVALIISAVYTLGKNARFGYKRITVSAIVVILIAFFDVSPIYLILAGGIGSIIINKLWKKEEE